MNNVRQRTLTIEVGKTEYVFCSPIVEELANSESAYAGKSDKASLEEAQQQLCQHHKQRSNFAGLQVSIQIFKNN